MAVLSMFTIGCTENDELTEIQAANEQEQKNVPSVPSPPLSDELSATLAATQGISDVVVEDSINELKNEKYRFYSFNYDQLIDHTAPSKGTFKQRVRIRIGKSGLTAPVVLYTHGYNMPDDFKDSYAPEMTNYLDASTLWVEHRYFGKSQVDPVKNLEFTYLNADQAAQDLHAIVSLMKQVVFKQSGKWVSTGISKDGITTGLYAYYSDKYGWDDIDLYMPFCAPYLEATPQSCDDPKIGQYLYKNSGSGYPQGSVEDIAYQRIRQIPTTLLQNKELRDACLRLYHQKVPDEYVEVINTYGRDEEKATAGLLNNYFMSLFDKFSYILFKKWAPLVPEISDTERMAEFILMDKNDLQAYIKQLESSALDYNNYQYVAEVETKEPRAMTDQEILAFWDITPEMPYYVQAARELGNIRLDLSSLNGLNFPGSSNDFAFLAASVSHQFEVSVLYQRYAHQWDGGQLMKSFRQWVKTQDKFNMIFCYSANDPWTGGAIDESTNPRVKRFICKNGVHDDNFLDSDYYSEAEKQQLIGYVRSYLGI